MTAWLTNVSLTSGINVNHAGFVCNRETIHFFYRDGTNLKYRKSTDEGSTFSAATTIATSVTEIPLDKSVAVSANGQIVHVVYNKNTNNVSAPVEIWYLRSTDAGATWATEVQLWNGTDDGNNRFVRNALVADKTSDDVYLTWVSTIVGAYTSVDIYYRKSTDGGATWGTKSVLFTSSVSPGRPDLDAHGSRLYLTWTDSRDGTLNGGGETYFATSTNGGTSWSTEVNLSGTTTHDTLRPGIASSTDGVVVCVWQYPINSEDIYFCRSTDYGSTWTTSSILASGTGIQEHVSIAFHDGIFAVVYTDANDTPGASYVSYSKNLGVTWTTPQKPYAPSANSGAPLIDFSNRFLMILDKINDTTGVALLRSPIFLPDPVTTTLLDDANRADDASPPPGSDWTVGLNTGTPTNGLAIVSNQFTRKSSGSYRQGGTWIGTPSTIGPDADIVVEVSAWVNTNANGFTFYGRVVDLGSTTVDGYGIDVSRDTGANTFAIWVLVNGAAVSSKVGAIGSISSGDLFCLTMRSDLIVGWHKPTGNVWSQVAAILDSTNTATGTMALEMYNNQDTKITNIWATDISLPKIPPSAWVTIR